MASGFSLETAGNREEVDGGSIYRVGDCVVSSGGNEHPLDVLRALAKPPHLSRDGETWSVAGVLERVANFVNVSITSSFLVGTLLWGYGHRWFPPPG